MPEKQVFICITALLAFVFLLNALGVMPDLKGLLEFLSSNGREAIAVTAFLGLLGFLKTL